MQTRNTMDKKVLSFPISKQTTPIKEVVITGDTQCLVLNIPTSVLSPSFSTLSDGIHVNGYRSYVGLLGLLFNMSLCNFFVNTDEAGDETSEEGSKKPKKPTVDVSEKFYQHQGKAIPATEIYMEYLLDKDSVVDPEGDNEEILVNNCTAIRFYFVYHGLEMLSLQDPLSNGLLNTLKFNKDADNAKKTSSKITTDKILPHKFHTLLRTPNDFIREAKLYISDASLSEAYDVDYSSSFHPKKLFLVNHGVETTPNQNYREPELSEDFFRFGIPSLVYRIPRCFWNPVSLFSLTLPRTVEWREESFAAKNVTINILTNKDLLECYLAKVVDDKNIYRKVTDSYDYLHDKINSNVNASIEKREESKKKLSLQFANVLDRIFEPNISISDENDAMVQFATTINTFSPIKDYHLIDSSLTPFANFMISYYFALEYAYKIVSTHNLIHVLLLSFLDAYRDEKNLHANILIAGEAAAGKSHALDTISSIFIPGTVIKMGDFTEKSLTTSEKEFDKIVVFHESPPLFLGDNNMKGGPDTGSGILKDLLTSCEASFEQCFVEDGKRLLMRSKKERIGVHVIATNESVHSIPLPMRSRMYVLDLHKVKKTYNTVGEYNKLEEPEEVKVAITEFTTNFLDIHRKCQLGVSFVNKLIRVGALNEPALGACNGILIEFERYSKQLTGNRTDDRYMQIIKYLIRSQTIYFAVYRYFTDRRAGGGYGLPVKYVSFLEGAKHSGIQPYLFATEEIATFVISLFVDNQCKRQSSVVMEYIINKVLANENTVVSPGKDHRITPDKTETRGGVNWGSFKINFIGRFSIVNQIHMAASQGDFELSKEQIDSEINDLNLGGVIDISQLEQRTFWMNMDYLGKFFSYEETKKCYSAGEGGYTHLEKIINNIADENFASKRRVMSSFPIDNNHMNILKEVNVKRNSKTIPTITKNSYGGLLNGMFVPIQRQLLKHGRELDKYRMVVKNATQETLDYYMYDPNTQQEPTRRYPEEYLLASYSSVGVDYKNKAWRDLLESYANDEDSDISEQSSNKKRKLN